MVAVVGTVVVTGAVGLSSVVEIGLSSASSLSARRLKELLFWDRGGELRLRLGGGNEQRVGGRGGSGGGSGDGVEGRG